MTNKYSAKAIIKASAETIFEFYSDVKNWKDWQPDLEFSDLEGDFEDGSEGTFKLKGSQPTKFTLGSVQSNNGFNQVMNLPFGSKYIVTRRIELLGSSCEIRHAIEFEGFFGWLTKVFAGSKYSERLQKSVDELQKLCEE